MIDAGANKISVKAIVAGVCAYHEIRRADLISQRRTREVVRPRQTAMWLAKQLTGQSLPAIGRMLGGRDHTTVLHGIRVIDRLVETDPIFAQEVEEIAVALGAVVGKNAFDPALTKDRDPLETALAITERADMAIDISAESVREMAACLVGYALRIGALRFDGEDGPDPELLPIETAAPVIRPDPTLAKAIDAVRTAYDAFQTRRYSVGERQALDLLSKNLLGLFEARSNMEI